ncbi:MAG: hypothetical protein R3Y28_01545 [Candidatus Gastranaerophilales bacterium]
MAGIDFSTDKSIYDNRQTQRVVPVVKATEEINSAFTVEQEGPRYLVQGRAFDKDPYDEINGEIEDFKQGQIGDCYLLSSLYSLSRTTEGAVQLKNNIKKNENSYTVTLPGALAVADDFKSDKLISSIRGHYVITRAEFDEAVRSGEYVKNDPDVILYELAFEKYREDVLATNEANGHVDDQYVGSGTIADPLEGGWTSDSNFILTGEKSMQYNGNYEKSLEVPTYQIQSVDPTTYDYVNSERLSSLLDKKMNDEDRYSMTISFKLGLGAGKHGNHALSIKRVDEENIYIVNPWDTSKEHAMSRKTFLNSAYRVSIQDTESNMFSKCMDMFEDTKYIIKEYFQ